MQLIVQHITSLLQKSLESIGTPPHLIDPGSAGSISPPVSLKGSKSDKNEIITQVTSRSVKATCINVHFNFQSLIELRSVFTPELAHTAYLPFLRQIGLDSLEISLKNHERVRYLCTEYEREMQATFPNVAPDLRLGDDSGGSLEGRGSIGSNVAVVGNRIDVQLTGESTDARCGDVLSLIRLAPFFQKKKKIGSN